MVPLHGENRVIVKSGLQLAVRETENDGLAALLNSSGLKTGIPNEVTSTDIAFQVAPRINACGRMGTYAPSAHPVVEILTSQWAGDAGRSIANNLTKLNDERKQKQAELTKTIVEWIRCARFQDVITSTKIITVHGNTPQFQPGIIGLAAADLVQIYGKPAIVMCKDGDRYVASCRSVPGFNITDHIRDYLDDPDTIGGRFGGHEQAAGFSLPADEIDYFSEVCLQFEGQAIIPDQPPVEVDYAINLWDIDEAFIRSFDVLQPYGQGNPEPTFVTRGLIRTNELKLMKDRHCKFGIWYEPVLFPAEPRSITAVFFNCPRHGDLTDPRYQLIASADSDAIDLVYTLSVNEWRGCRTPQLMVKHVFPHASG